jgi:hypothetical protein
MMDRETGGPAFPYSALQPGGPTMYADNEGMTLRDYFAAKAMQADMMDGIHENDFAWSAGRAYKMADAMLKARLI